ncbi:MAG: carboxypeptidase regulatory-like domain-containing protein [Acidobacteria bacterium]|nr:carboxypeptidase regulatory-like domain-containing protein [Acidobacteriota bacterium]
MNLRALALIFTLAFAAPAFAAQSDQGRFTGRVTDGSGGALPGVTVTITGARGSKPVVVTTDSVGQYQSPPLPDGSYAVSFELTGFETRANPTVLLRGGEVFVLDRQLAIAALSETVEVTGAAPPPPVIAPPPPPLRVQPKTIPIPKVVLASVCAPTRPGDVDQTVAHILGHRYDTRRELFSQGDVLRIDVGADMGIGVGQNYVVRRRVQIGERRAQAKDATFGEQTAGLVQVVETTPDAAVVVAVYACGEFMPGDSLEPFDALPVVQAQAPGTPQFDEPARVVFGEQGRMLGAGGQMVVIDHGSAHGVTRGQRVTIFKRAQGSDGPVIALGDGIVSVVRPQSSTIQITRTTEAVEIGTLMALHK